MNADLKDYIKSCATSAQYKAAQQPDEPMEQPVKPAPENSELRYLHFNGIGKNYLVTLDHYSSFFEVDSLLAMTSERVIRKLKPHF